MADQINIINKLRYRIAELQMEIALRQLQRAINFQSLKVTRSFINQTIKKYFPDLPITHFDNYYYLANWDIWQLINELDWVKTKKWLEDARDCDNLVNAYSANASMFWELNSVLRVYGKLYRGTTGFVNYHYWNLIILPTGELIFYEPQNGQFTNFTGGQLLIGGKLYVPISLVAG